MPSNNLTKQQIGRCGELLVQYKLLMVGIESSHLTTDAGIDLAAYSPKKKRPSTIQVKTNLRPKPTHKTEISNTKTRYNIRVIRTRR